MKLVGGDSGRCEREQLVDSVVLAPSERAVVDVLLRRRGRGGARAPHPGAHVPARHGHGRRRRGRPGPDGGVRHAARQPRDGGRARAASRPTATPSPTRRIAFVAEMEFEAPEGTVVYSCPMHPEVVSPEEGKCPECGMKLMPTAGAVAYTCPMHPDVVSDEQGKCPDCGMKLMPASAVAAAGARSRACTTHDRARPATTTMPPPAGSSGRTTWSRSTGPRRRRTRAGS